MGACNHPGICSICYFRIRCLLQDFECPICKQPQEFVVVSHGPPQKYQQFNIYGNDLGPEYVFDDRSRMFFPKDHYRNRIESLMQFKCIACGKVKRDMKTLKNHLQSEHGIHMCGLCIEHKSTFPAEQKCYSQSTYEAHLRQG